MFANTLIYFRAYGDVDFKWFITEICLWICIPFVALFLCVIMKVIIRGGIYNGKLARQKLVKATPWIITLNSTIMYSTCWLHNYTPMMNWMGGDGATYIMCITCSLFPFFALFASRLYMLRRGRHLSNFLIDEKTLKNPTTVQP